jgi:hypothetical protein
VPAEVVPTNEPERRGQDGCPQSDEQDQTTATVIAVGGEKSGDDDSMNGESQLPGVKDDEAAAETSVDQLSVPSASPASDDVSVGTGTAAEGKEAFAVGGEKSEDDSMNGESQLPSVKDDEAAAETSVDQLSVPSASPASDDVSVGTGTAAEGKVAFADGKHSVGASDTGGGEAIDDGNRSQAVEDASGSVLVADTENALKDLSIDKDVVNNSRL